MEYPLICYLNYINYTNTLIPLVHPPSMLFPFPSCVSVYFINPRTVLADTGTGYAISMIKTGHDL